MVSTTATPSSSPASYDRSWPQSTTSPNTRGAVLRRHAVRGRGAPTAYAHVLLNMNALAASDTARAAFDLPHPDALRGRKA